MFMKHAALLATATTSSCATLANMRPPVYSHLAVEERQRCKGRPEGRQQLERTERRRRHGRKPRHRALPAPLLVGSAAGGAAAGVELLGGSKLALAACGCRVNGTWFTVSSRFTQLAVRSTASKMATLQYQPRAPQQQASVDFGRLQRTPTLVQRAEVVTRCWPISCVTA